MEQSGLPASVRKFVAAHLTTGAQAEVLVLVHRQPRRSWTAAELAREFRISAEHAESLLAQLADVGLMRRDADRFSYEPRSADLGRAADEFAAAYPTYRVAINTIIFTKPSRSVQNFSDAFRFREEEE